MDKEFKPSPWIFASKMIWISTPVVVIILMDYWTMWSGSHRLLSALVAIWTPWMAFSLVLLHGKTISFQSRRLAITDFFGRQRFYSWDLMRKTVLETKSVWIFGWQAFIFDYLEKTVSYQLSELSPDDQERAVELIKLNLPGIPETFF